MMLCIYGTRVDTYKIIHAFIESIHKLFIDSTTLSLSLSLSLPLSLSLCFCAVNHCSSRGIDWLQWIIWVQRAWTSIWGIPLCWYESGKLSSVITFHHQKITMCSLSLSLSLSSCSPHINITSGVCDYGSFSSSISLPYSLGTGSF